MSCRPEAVEPEDQLPAVALAKGRLLGELNVHILLALGVEVSLLSIQNHQLRRRESSQCALLRAIRALNLKVLD